MRCTICCAVFGLLVLSERSFRNRMSRPRSLARPRIRVVGVRWFARASGGIRARPTRPCSLPVSRSGSRYLPCLRRYRAIARVRVCRQRLAFPSAAGVQRRHDYTVTDYWRVNDQLHFITIEEGATKSVPHAVPFGDLDVQRTTDANVAQGFRFVLRDEPIEQWLEHHAQHPPRRHRDNGVS